MNIPALIKDLAVMMLTAGVITIVFKKIKQPLILGYILAGFLLSPYFPWFANIVDTGSIEAWSEIGIIFLMFHLGLEFNLHKMLEVGGSAIITCLVETVGMIIVGSLTGKMLGFSTMDSIVLGAMLVMSSTTIIIKVFDELSIKAKYTETVFGILVIEDIVGIFMMVILSTIGVSKDISGTEVAGKLTLMLLYLVVWLLLGIYIIPTFINKTVKYMTDEMLLVISIGICLGMVLLADWLGFSSALGAFLAGSLIAGTVHVERVEHLTRGVKDLFGAVFFISVGMMANPQMIAKYWLQILIIIIVTIVGKLLFNTLGMLLSGQPITNSVETGFALAQIGEFAFILASLGYSLGIIDEFLYPIVVAVSVITTFTTPFLIKLAPKFATWIEKKLPPKAKKKLNQYTSDKEDKDLDTDWQDFIKRFCLRTVIYGGIMFIAMLATVKYVEPMLENLEISALAAKLISLAIIYVVMIIFVGPLLDKRNNLFTALWLKKVAYRLPLLASNAIKWVIISLIALVPLREFFKMPLAFLALLIIVIVYIIVKVSTSGTMATNYLHLETRFLRNLNERFIEAEEASGNKQKWLDEKLHIISYKLPEQSEYDGKSIREIGWGYKYKIYVVKIKRDKETIILPHKDVEIKAGDKLYLVGEKRALQTFYKLVKVDQPAPIRTLKEFMEFDYPDKENILALVAIKAKTGDGFASKTVKQSNIRDTYNCVLLGIQKDGLPIIMPDPNLKISKGDILWLMGSTKNVGWIASKHMEK